MNVRDALGKRLFDFYRNPQVNRQIQELKSVDQKVRQHEMAHKVAGGQYAGAVHFEYIKGPDGKLYAVAGEVDIDVSDAPTPEETIRKMEQVKRAALAPLNPSSQDKKVAAIAEAKKQRAEQELQQQEGRKRGDSIKIDLLV
ncbi:MAG: protein-glutamate O-methyltransferase [Deferribacteres bacterium]|nr:protein-glutamate O-methyltransferase [Deferribacteres bacterium]